MERVHWWKAIVMDSANWAVFTAKSICINYFFFPYRRPRPGRGGVGIQIDDALLCCTLGAQRYLNL